MEDLTVTVKIKDLEEMINKEVEKRIEEKMNKIDQKILNIRPHKNGKCYRIEEKGNKINEFDSVIKAIKYLNDNYNTNLTKNGFNNLRQRLNTVPERQSNLDKIFRGKVLKIETF